MALNPKQKIANIIKTYNTLLTEEHSKGRYEIMKILHIEDDNIFLKVMKKALNTLGVNHDQATNGDEAEEIIFNNKKLSKYDIIICNGKIPGARGTELVRSIKLKSPKTYIIANSATENYNMISAGADSFIEKSELNLFDKIKQEIEKYNKHEHK